MQDDPPAEPSGASASAERRQSYRIVLQQDEDGRFVATCPDLPGVVTDGIDRNEAMENARHAVSDMLKFLGKPDKEFDVSPAPPP